MIPYVKEKHLLQE